MSEPEVLNRLFGAWISLALEYGRGASDIRGVFIYASSERSGTSGQMFANAYFDQAGDVVAAIDVHSPGSSPDRAVRVQQLLLDDLQAAEAAFHEEGIPAPTEYRVFFEPATRRTEVELSREIKYRGSADLSPRHGIRYWLGDRAPKHL